MNETTYRSAADIIQGARAQIDAEAATSRYILDVVDRADTFMTSVANRDDADHFIPIIDRLTGICDEIVEAVGEDQSLLPHVDLVRDIERLLDEWSV